MKKMFTLLIALLTLCSVAFSANYNVTLYSASATPVGGIATSSPSPQILGTGSWQNDPAASKMEFYLPLAALGTFTIDDIASLQFSTQKASLPAPAITNADFFWTIYTNPYNGGFKDWYGQKLTSEPMYYNNLSAPYDTWSTYQTATGTNQMTFFDANHSPAGYGGAPTLADIKAGLVNFNYTSPYWTSGTGIDYGAQNVKYISISTGSGTGNQMVSYLDKIIITLTNGDILTVDLENGYPNPITNIQAPISVTCDTYDVPVIVKDFRNIANISHTLNYNSSVLELLPIPVSGGPYSGITLNTAISSAIPSILAPGTFRLSYIGDALNLADDDILYTLHFKLLPAASGQNTALKWNSDDEGCQYSGPGLTPAVYPSIFNNLSWEIPTRPVKNTNTGLEYCTIQAAINDPLTLANHTIEVATGTYPEHVVINKVGLIVKNAASASPIINGSSTGTVVTVTANNVKLQGFKVINSGITTNDAGVALIANGLTGVTGCFVTGNEITGNNNGLGILGGSGNTVTSNNIHENNYGVLLIASNGNTLESNTIDRNTKDGIAIQNAIAVGGSSTIGSTVNLIKANTISSSSNDGIFIGENCNNSIVTDNTINGGRAGIHVWKSNSNKITGNTIQNCTKQDSDGYGHTSGIRLYIANTNTITGNLVTLNYIAIRVNGHAGENCSGNLINNNDLSNSTEGIAMAVYNNDLINAECNWWGTANGNAVLNATGVGFTTYTVDYSPWLLDGTNNATGTGFLQTTPHCDGTPIVIASTTPIHLHCGDLSGSIDVVYTGGTADYTVSWTGTASGSSSGITGLSYSITGLGAGTYDVTVTEANGSYATTTGVLIQYLPVKRTTLPATYNYYATIQAAINAATAGDVIDVCAGTYVESIAIEIDNLTINGPNAGIDPNGATARGAEAIIHPTEWYGIYTLAAGIKIDGLTIDGQTTCGYGVYAATETGQGGLTFTNNIVKNMATYGFFGYATAASAASSNNLITENLFTNIPGRAIVSHTNYYANITENVINNTGIGIYTEGATNPESTGTVKWENNKVSASRAGIWYHLAYGTSTPLTIKDNTVNGEDNPAGTRWYGIWLSMLRGDLNPIISGNIISGTAVTQAINNGYVLWDSPITLAAGITIQGGSVKDVNYGVFVNNWEGSYTGTTGSNGLSTKAKIDGISITNASLAGVYVKDNTLNTLLPSAVVYAEILNNTISGGGAGILVEGTDATANVHNNTLPTNYFGVALRGTNANTVKLNTISNSGEYGIFIGEWSASTSSNNIITENTITTSGSDGIYVDMNSDGNSLTKNIISGTLDTNGEGNGIYCWTANTTTISENIIFNNATNGIEFSAASNNNVSANTIYGNALNGILIRPTGISASNNAISDNNIYSNGNAGILMRQKNPDVPGQTSGTITNNFLTGNKYGVNIETSILDATGWAVNNNSITGNTTFGIANNGAGALSATCNWWGTAIPAGVAAAISDPVTYINWLVSGVDASGDAGFQPESGKCIGSPIALTCADDKTEASCQPQATIDASYAAWLTTATASGCSGTLANNSTGAPSACAGGSKTVTWTYTSDCGNLTCQATFTVAAPPALVINLPADVTVNQTQEKDPFATGYATATDCQTATVITFDDDRSMLNLCNSTGYITRTWTATNSCGTIATGKQNITVIDVNDPVVQVPANITTNTDPDLCSAVVNFTTTATDFGYFQGFENAAWLSGGYANNPSVDWNEYNSAIARVPSTTDGITSSTGSAHAVINSIVLPASPNNNSGAFCRLGGYNGTFGLGFISKVDVYFNMYDAEHQPGYGWDLDQAVSTSSNGNLRDFVYHVGGDATGIYVCVGNGSSNAPPAMTPANIKLQPSYATITASGWYTMEWETRNNAGFLAVDFNIRNSSGTIVWTNTINSGDAIAGVGGNRYMWFNFLAVDKLPFDNTSLQRKIAVTSSPASGTAFAKGVNTVSATALDACGKTTTNTFTITVNDNQPPVITCPADITVHMNSGSTYVGSIGNPTVTDNCGATASNDHPGAFPEGVTIVKWTASDGTNSSTCDQTVNVVTNTLSGTLKYNNGPKTPMNSVTLTLTPGPQSVVTETNGEYSFGNLTAGTYTIAVTNNIKPVGGINSTDAGAANYWSANNVAIEHAKFLAGDVNANNYINSTDALSIQRYFVYNEAFNRAPWSYWKKGDMVNSQAPATSFSVALTGNVSNYDLYAMCTGDFNGSFNPSGSKAVNSSLLLSIDGTEVAGASQEFDLQLRTAYAMELAAASLILDIPTDLVEVTEITLNGSTDPVTWVVNGNELRIGWNSNTPVYIPSDGSLLTLKLKTTSAFTIGNSILLALVSDPLNELADASYNVIENAELLVNRVDNGIVGIDVTPGARQLSLSNYPNPFRGSTTVSYEIPYEGKVILEGSNMLGQKVTTLVEKTQRAGKYTLNLDGSKLNPGIYSLTLRLITNDGEMVRTIKLVVNQ